MPPRRKSKTAKPLTGPAAILVVLLIAVFMGYSALTEDLPADPTAPSSIATTLPSSGSAANGDITVFFSDPLSAQPDGAAEAALLAALDGARERVDIAVYNISLGSLADALVRAKDRGVQVRMVMESEAMQRSVPERLQAAGIPIVGDLREGLMHNKFTIIDGQEVWLGSMNYTANSFYDDFNNLVRIRSQQMVRNYQANFDEMFTDKRFGNDKEANTPFPLVDVSGTDVEVYFSPDDGVAEQVVDELHDATQSIDFLAYSFTRDDFAAAIIAQHSGGARVRGVFDKAQYASNAGGEYDTLEYAGLDVRLDGISGLMHNKVIILDGKTVITGSYNFSASAENNNDENLVIIHDPAVAAQYLAHFEKVWSTAK